VTLYDRAELTRWGYRDVSPHALHEAATPVLVVDVRAPQDYAAGHIPGATLVPSAQVGVALPTWDHHADIVVVCRCGACSAQIAEALISAGFHQVMNLAGGMTAYAEAGLPIERGPWSHLKHPLT